GVSWRRPREVPMSEALLLIDIQNDYFPGGAYEVPGSTAAAQAAARLLAAFRGGRGPVVHVQHHAVRPGSTFFLPGTPGAEIHALVQPQGAEPVVTKHFPNSFRETDLLDTLRKLGVTRLVVAGMMTHMCIDATVRAANDLGFACKVAADACAAPGQALGGIAVPPEHVHAAFLAALSGSYAEVVSASEA
ncbi:MAG TPA: cysteine hydrolase family protein, partial [Holophaga sp.]|nr:cysteine hydrolase family protein [Holophaga sp.]